MKQIKLNSKIISVLLFTAILLFSVVIRLFIFDLAHKGSDEMQYIGLAYKIDKCGMKSYNLRNLFYNYDLDGMLFHIDDIADESSISVLEGIPKYYDAPLFHKPPALPFAIMISYKLFGGAKGYVSAVRTPQDKIKAIYGKRLKDAQFYISITCLFFTIFAVGVIFLITQKMFDAETGFYSAFLFSVTPITIMTSVRLWTDIPALAFMFFALYIYLKAREKQSLIEAVVAGVVIACAGLTRTVMLILLPIILLVEVVFWVFGEKPEKKHRLVVVTFLFTGVVLSFPWFMLVYKHYGSFIYFPAKELVSIEDNKWLKMISDRNPLLYLINPLFQNPALIFFYFAVFRIFPIKKFFKEDKDAFAKTVLLVIFFGFIAVFAFVSFRELRYIMPAIVVMAIFSASVFKSAIKKIIAKAEFAQGIFFSYLFLGLIVWWCTSLASYFLQTNSVLITFPF